MVYIPHRKLHGPATSDPADIQLNAKSHHKTVNMMLLYISGSIWLFLSSISLTLQLFAQFRGWQPHEGGSKSQHVVRQAAQRRQDSSSVASTTTDDSSTSVLFYATPSPSAQPIPITSQGETITSYVLQNDYCLLPPLAFSNTTVVEPSTTYMTYSISTPTGTGECFPTYMATVTPVCSTTLGGLGTYQIITNCSQEVTFLTAYGSVIDEPTQSSGSITESLYTRTETTYYIAPWQDFTTTPIPPTPPQDVAVKICSTYRNGTTVCVERVEVWLVSTYTAVSTMVVPVDFTATFTEPGTLIIGTFSTLMTLNETVVSTSTEAAILYDIEAITTITLNTTAGPTSSEQSTSTSTLTMTQTMTSTVVYASSLTPLTLSSPL